jgi:hypothetical protein
MTTDQATSIISEYQQGVPFNLIKQTYKVCGRDITHLLAENGIPVRGKGGRKGGHRYSDYWEGFLIQPIPSKGEAERRKALRNISIHEFNPIGTL